MHSLLIQCVCGSDESVMIRLIFIEHTHYSHSKYHSPPPPEVPLTGFMLKTFFLLYVDHECALRKGSGFSFSAPSHHRLFLFLDYVPVSDNKD